LACCNHAINSLMTLAVCPESSNSANSGPSLPFTTQHVQQHTYTHIVLTRTSVSCPLLGSLPTVVLRQNVADIWRRFLTPFQPTNSVKELKDLRAPTATRRNPSLASLWSPYVIGQTIIFSSCNFFLSFFSSPNLSGRRLDVYHTLAHGVALVRI